MRFTIEHTTLSDIPFIENLLNLAIDFQRENGFPVWPAFEREELYADIQNNVQFKIIVDDTPASIFSIHEEDRIIWRHHGDTPALYMHRVVTHPDFRGLKLFQRALDWTIDVAREKKTGLIRLDTWADNPPLIDYYKSFGFSFVEYFKTPDIPEVPMCQRGNRVILLEKRLD